MVLTVTSKVGLLAAAGLLAGVGHRLHLKQRGGAPGGPIARSKLLWLVLVLFLWLFVPALLALDAHVPIPYRIVLGGFALNFWLRAGIEMVMMYVSNSWRPPYGIAHDLLSIGLVAGLAVAYGPLPVDGTSAWLFALVVVICVSLALEAAYAWTFYRLVGGQTHGEGAIWFASTEDPRFARVVRVTAIANMPLYGFTILFVAQALRG